MNAQGQDRGVLWALALLSAATLAFEISLTRIFAIAQFYHFAFMIVSLALLGSGASGAALARLPGWSRLPRASAMAYAGWGLALTTIGSYLLTLYVPFDSFRIALDWRQAGVLFLHYLALATPFFCSGLAVGGLLSASPGEENRVYAATMAGSAAGCLLAIVGPAYVGEEGMVLVVAAMGVAASLLVHMKARPQRVLVWGAHLSALLACLGLASALPPFLRIQLSPYKALSYTLLYPDATVTWQRSNSFSRVDVVHTSSIRSLPGRGFLCTAMPPPQRGLAIDGDDLSPISSATPGFDQQPFTGCLLGALPYQLRPAARALVLEPRGGFDVLLALSEGASHVTAIESNPLIVEAVRREGPWAGNLYDDSRVRVIVDDPRAYAGRSVTNEENGRFDLIVLSLTAPQRPVMSGAYSLSEDYTYTVQAFEDYMALLNDDGLLVVTRWLQVPPSESIRAFALAVEAVEQRGGDAPASLVALRSYQQMLILARQGAFTDTDLVQVRAFAEHNAFDLVYAPDLQLDEVNRYNILPAPDYYNVCLDLLQASDRDAWYRAYPFDITPPTDNHPFFGHFFKWGQLDAVLESAGHIWQPFGGAGYVVLIVLLTLAVLASLLLVWIPFLISRWRKPTKPASPTLTTTPFFYRDGAPSPQDTPQEAGASRVLLYFTLLGLGYLCAEIPMLQWFILFLGNPAWSMATVLFALLLFSGVGSYISRRIPLRAALLAIPLLLVIYAIGVPLLFRAAIGAPLVARIALSIAVLAPPGVLMGMPFPGGMASLCHGPSLAPWAWASNGTASVIASILAALLALWWGFAAVLGVGALCYLGAWATVRRLPAHLCPSQSPRP